MATLIPALGACASSMTGGERRLAERLEQKLDEDYLLWYDVPMGPRYSHPDFCVMHPRRGILVLEVKDWRLATIQQAGKQTWTIIPDGTPRTVINPLEQARQYAHQVVDALKRDPQLTQPEGAHQGQIAFPWSYGVVFTNITRKQFKAAELQHAIEPHRVVCSDEMTESVEPEDLQSRLWGMFPYMMRGVMSLPQLDRVRWIMFPEVRVQTQGALFDDSNPIILDQPEENLDNETVVSLLVPVLTEAKKRCQIIMVTHNPNLAGVCDAEQVIWSVFDRKNASKISYFAGSIENPAINGHVVNVLEGTMPAFTNRSSKYHGHH